MILQQEIQDRNDDLEQLFNELQDKLVKHRKNVNKAIERVVYEDYESIEDLIIAVNRVVDNDKEFDKIVSWYKKQIPLVLTLSVAMYGSSIPKAIEDNINAYISAFTKDIYNYKSLLKSDVIANVLSGAEKKNIVSRLNSSTVQVNNLFTKMSDSIMMVLRLADEAIAEKESLDYAFYAGGLIETSRDFCIARNERIFSKDTILSWNKLSFKGKIEGSNVLITLGGWRCRHYLVWVDKETAEKYGYDQYNT